MRSNAHNILNIKPFNVKRPFDMFSSNLVNSWYYRRHNQITTHIPALHRPLRIGYTYPPPIIIFFINFWLCI